MSQDKTSATTETTTATSKKATTSRKAATVKTEQVSFFESILARSNGEIRSGRANLYASQYKNSASMHIQAMETQLNQMRIELAEMDDLNVTNSQSLNVVDSTDNDWFAKSSALEFEIELFEQQLASAKKRFVKYFGTN